ncbi:low affinity iron permease family protein [Nocardia rhamnosiphila]
MFVPHGVGNEVYHLLLNSVTSIVTFLMAFIIQSAQNCDSRAIQTTLDAQNRMLIALAVLAHKRPLDGQGCSKW